MKKAILLVNLGTPDSPSVPDVRKYLSEFLNDPYVMTMPWIIRKVLVNAIIVPFRAPKSAKVYQELWTDEGSPLMIYGEKVQELLQKHVGDDIDVHLAMRYQNPSMDKVIGEMETKGYDQVHMIPLYPQYASSTTETIIVKTEQLMAKWKKPAKLTMTRDFYDHPKFIQTIVERAKKYNIDEYDHVLFSYHGLPKSHLKPYPCKGDSSCECRGQVEIKDRDCYLGACFSTTEQIVQALNIPRDKYSEAYQSRLYNGWLEPFADKELIKLAKAGKKKVLVFCPAFVADCLETIIEIGEEYNELYEEHGGEKVQLVESLNDHPMFVECLAELATFN